MRKTNGWWRALTLSSLILVIGVTTALGQQADPLFDDLDQEYREEAHGFPDPLEPVNRGTLRFNQEVDRWFLDPLTRVYRFMIPDRAKRAIQRFMSNLNSPGVMINDALQCEMEAAGITLWRFIINSTIGLGGLLDPAEYLGVEGHVSDFDQTLAIYDVPSGPFLMLPVLGPTTARGVFGTIVDIAMRPTTYFTAGADQFVFIIIHSGSAGLATREANLDALNELEGSSLDYYAALRNAYYQKRLAEIARRDQRSQWWK